MDNKNLIKVNKINLYIIFILFYTLHLIILKFNYKENTKSLVVKDQVHNNENDNNLDEKIINNIYEDDIFINKTIDNIKKNTDNNTNNIINNDNESIPNNDNESISGNDIINKITNKVSEINKYEKKLEYELVNYVDVYSGDKIIINKNNKNYIVKLINISENKNNIDILRETLKNQESFYIEYDVLKEKNGILYGYIWLNKPDINNIEEMLNYFLMRYDSIDSEIKEPNMKYSYQFNKKESKRLLNEY